MTKQVRITDANQGGDVKVTLDGEVVTITGGGGDGSILDGVNSAIKATVLDFTNSNPLAVRLSDTNGDYVAAGAGTQYTEDAAAAADPVGSAVMLVRDDAPGALVSADGDNVAQRGTNYGAAYVQVVNSSGSFVDTFGGGTQYTEGDIDASITGTALMFEGAADTLVAAPGTAADGLLVNLGGNNDVTVTGTVTANLSATDNAVLDAIEADTTTLAGAVSGTEMQVDVVTLPNVTLAAGTNTNEVVGDAAHDAAVAGNPVLVCGAAQANDDTAPPNRVSAESDATRFATDFDGCVHVRTHGPQVWSYHANGSSALTDASVHAAPGAGLSLYVTDIIVSSGAATAMNVFFEEGASTVLGPYYLEAVAGRGLAIHFQTPKKITANTALTVTTSAAIAHAVDVTGFTAQG